MIAYRTVAMILALGLTTLPGCRSNTKIENPLALPTQATLSFESNESGAALQRILEVEADLIQTDFADLAERSEWRERGYFSGPEHDEIERLFFRFIVNQGAYWGELDRLGGTELLRVDDIERPRAHVLALHVGLSLADSSAFLVSSFQEDEIAIAKLNEAFYRSEIPRGSYDQLRRAVTSPSRQEALEEAWAMYQQALSKTDSPTGAIAAGDDDLAALATGLPHLYERTMKRIGQIRESAAGGPGEARTRLEHSEIAQSGRSSEQAVRDFDYQTRALVFTHVSRLHRPRAAVITFTAEQKQQIFSALQPADLLLTYTAGYVSSIFIPGEFKHGITYVGDDEQRRAAGLGVESLPEAAMTETRRFAANLEQDELENGGRADLIEAVAEGVKFSDLDHILDTHINRLLVLRPALDPAERAAFLAAVFAYLGDPYDFRFDFADASRQVCTEVIYRALEGKAGFAFELTDRGGHPTLSADDIVEYHLAQRAGGLEFILLAEEDPDATDQRSRILTALPGQIRLRELMGERIDEH
jgi:hypothetical protein